MDKEINEVTEGYKETEIGVLPEEWEVVRLGDLSDSEVLKLKNGFPCGNHNDQGIGIPHLRPLNVNSDGQISLCTIKYIQTERDISDYLLQLGDIIFNNTNSEELVGKTAYWDKSGDYVLSNHMTIIRIISPNIVEPYFLARFLHKRWFEGYYLGVCRRHVNQASISLERLKQVLVPLPPLHEQRKIAHVLSTIQRAIELQDKVIAAARELKKSLMRHLFTYGPLPVDQVDRVPLKETEIGPVPEHWEVVNIGYVTTESYSGGTPSTKERAYWDGSIPWTTTALMGEEEIYLTKYQRLITEQALKETSTQLAPRGSLLLGTRVGVGKAAIATFDIAINQDITVLRIDNQKILPEFLAYGFKTDLIRESLKRKMRGTTIKGISRYDVLTLCIPLPSLHDQQQIVHILATIDQKNHTEETRKSTLQSLLQTMLHLLMTGKVRVKDLEVNVDAIGR